jgi:Phosphate-selective porin O and P
MKSRLLLLTLLSIIFMFSKTTVSQDFDFFEPKATIGGYGELHYNYSKTDPDPAEQVLDFHRFVIFLGYAWTEQWSFKSEIELEHNTVGGDKGKLELEQAFINYHYADYLGFQAGVVLVSSGLINEYHEPPKFLGVERPDYAKLIIPTTWAGNGMALYGTSGDFDYKLVITEGLNSDNFTEGSGIRNGRQHGFKVDAGNPLFNGRVDYFGLPGLRFGVSYVYNEARGDSSSNKISLGEFHAQYNKYGIFSTLEFGNISYSSGNIQSSRGLYFDLGYNIGKLLNIGSKIIPFIRYSNINTAAKTISGGDIEKKYHNIKWMFGLSFLPIDEVVFKVDYSLSTRELGSVTTDLINVGFGYWF